MNRIFENRQSKRACNRGAIPYVQAALVAHLLTSCTSLPPEFTLREDPVRQWDLNRERSHLEEVNYSYWDDMGADHGSLRMTIDLSAQTAYVYRGDVRVARSRVATGLPGHRTPTGTYSIMEKRFDKRSNLYGRILDGDGHVVVSDADVRKDTVPSGGRFLGAAMPYWMRLSSSGIGMHAGPIPSPGHPASHGCIRMPRDMAQQLFHKAPVGTPVRIVP